MLLEISVKWSELTKWGKNGLAKASRATKEGNSSELIGKNVFNFLHW